MRPYPGPGSSPVRLARGDKLGSMASVYERVLGSRVSELDPRLRAYFGEIPVGSVGRGEGVYAVAGSRHRWLWPVFALLAWRRVLFPELGHDIPFTVENRGDRTATRTFAFPRRTREMRDEMTVVDGSLRDRLDLFEVELLMDVVAGSLRMRSRRQWVRLGALRLRVPAIVTISLTEQAEDDHQRVDVRMTAPVLGEVFRYAGIFSYALSSSDR